MFCQPFLWSYFYLMILFRKTLLSPFLLMEMSKLKKSQNMKNINFKVKSLVLSWLYLDHKFWPINIRLVLFHLERQWSEIALDLSLVLNRHTFLVGKGELYCLFVYFLFFCLAVLLIVVCAPAHKLILGICISMFMQGRKKSLLAQIHF